MESLKDRVAIVTGASRGIGLGIAAELVRWGARVCVTARRPESLADAVAELGGPEVAIAVPGKADDAGHRAEAVAKTMEAFGRLDMLVNNAGINPVYGPVVDTDPAAAAKILAVNVLAPLAWTRRARDAWMGEHGGSIVNVASVAGVRASPGIGMYGVSKAALIRLTTELAVELGPLIRVNAVAPAVVKTKFHRPVRGAGRAGVGPLPAQAPRGTGGHRGRGRVPAVGRGELDHRPDPGARRRLDPRRRPVTRA